MNDKSLYSRCDSQKYNLLPFLTHVCKVNRVLMHECTHKNEQCENIYVGSIERCKWNKWNCVVKWVMSPSINQVITMYLSCWERKKKSRIKLINTWLGFFSVLKKRELKWLNNAVSILCGLFLDSSLLFSFGSNCFWKYVLLYSIISGSYKIRKHHVKQQHTKHINDTLYTLSKLIAEKISKYLDNFFCSLFFSSLDCILKVYFVLCTVHATCNGLIFFLSWLVFKVQPSFDFAFDFDLI